MPGRKSNKEEMKIDWGSALDSLELSPIPIERQEIWNGTEGYVAIIVDRPIAGKVGIFDTKA